MNLGQSKGGEKTKQVDLLCGPIENLRTQTNTVFFFQYAMCTLSSSNLTTSESIENLIQSV